MATPVATVEITPGTAGAWIDVDCSAYIPAGTATGITFHYVNTALSARECGWRKNGSTDARTNPAQIDIGEDEHGWASVGVDASGIAEFWVESTTEVDIYLTGYYTSDAVFFTNAVDKSFATTGSYQTVDISAETGADTAILALFDTTGNDATASLGYRYPGSTDDIYQTAANHSAFMVQLSGTETCEVKIGHATVDLYLMGYLVSGFVAANDKVDMSLAGTGAWTDLTALPAGAIGVAMEVQGTGTGDRWGLRKNGDTENLVYEMSSRRQFAIVWCDASQLVEGYISTTAADFFRIGYFTSTATAAKKAQHYARMR